MQAFPIAWALAVVLLFGVFFLYEVSSTGTVNIQNCCQYRLVTDMSAVTPFTGSRLPSIDNKDDVAFAANKVLDDERSVSGIYVRTDTSTSAFLIHQFETVPSISSDAVENPSINDAGTVAYNKSSISRLAVFAGSGGLLKPIAF